MYIDQLHNTLQVEVTNVPEFERLLRQAKEEADRLSETIRKLTSFTLDFKFTAVEDQTGDMDSASSVTNSAPT